MKYLAPFLFSLLILACKTESSDLPEYGKIVIRGKYTNQNGEVVDSTTLKGNIIVSDFVFTHCPTICPVMAKQMLRVQAEFEERKDIRMVSFSIDPERDTIGRLKLYTERIGVNDNIWNYLHSDQETVDSTTSSFQVFYEKNEDVPGGINHGGQVFLIDKTMELRGIYDGTKAEDMDELIADLHKLIQ